MSKAGEKVIQGLEEALQHARGGHIGARVWHAQDVAAIRAKLGLTQAAFAEQFGVSVGTLRNWEQGLRLPEGPARTLLTIIDKEPAAVARALSTRPPAKRATPKRNLRKRA